MSVDTSLMGGLYGAIFGPMGASIGSMIGSTQNTKNPIGDLATNGAVQLGVGIGGGLAASAAAAPAAAAVPGAAGAAPAGTTPLQAFNGARSIMSSVAPQPKPITQMPLPPPTPLIQPAPITSDQNQKTNIKNADRSVKHFLQQINKIYQ